MPASPIRSPQSDPAANDADWSDRTWVQASAWANFASERRELSCMLLGLSNPVSLRRILPALSDALNEIGYPWEVVALDPGDNAAISEVLAQWNQRSGFRSVVVPAQTSAAHTLTACLRAARGDAVLLLSERGCADIGLCPAAPSLRREFTRAIRASLRECAPDGAADSAGGTPSGSSTSGMAALWQVGDVTLLDRSAVDLLLSDR
jgi:hypothetical protein